MKKKNILLQVRVSENIIEELDKLIELGIFRSRSEAVAESLRRLLLDYSLLLSREDLVIAAYRSGKLNRDLGPSDTIEIDIEKAKENLRKFFNTIELDEIIGRIRGRKL